MKNLLVLFLFLGLFSTANAQFGVRGGYSAANFSDFQSKNIAGFHAGTYFRKEMGFVAFETGIQYSQKGHVRDGDPSTPAVKNDRLNYIDIPVLLRVNFLPFLNVFAGPQGSLLVSRKLEYVDGSTDTSLEPIKAYDLSGVVGVGAKLPLGFNAQVSYDIGFQSVNYYNQDVKNNVVKVSLGFDF